MFSYDIHFPILCFSYDMDSSTLKGCSLSKIKVSLFLANILMVKIDTQVCVWMCYMVGVHQ